MWLIKTCHAKFNLNDAKHHRVLGLVTNGDALDLISVDSSHKAIVWFHNISHKLSILELESHHSLSLYRRKWHELSGTSHFVFYRIKSNGFGCE